MSIHIAAIIPVGPGHEETYKDAVKSVQIANRVRGYDIAAVVVDDTEGKFGRSCARNTGVAEASGADWFYFLDADDTMMPDAIETFASEVELDPHLDGVWGELWNEYSLVDPRGKIVDIRFEKAFHDKAPWHDDWDLLVAQGPYSALHVGHFVRSKALERIGGWCERWDIGEDIECNWAIAAHGPFSKVAKPITKVRIWKASAVGPRGYGKIRPDSTARHLWLERTRYIADYWKERGRKPWTDAERVARDLGQLYPPTKKWGEEPT